MVKSYEINSVTLRNTTYQKKSILNSVNLDYVPWENNDMSNAFYNCRNLKEVTNINGNVTNMCNTFDNCWRLINAPTIPNSVTDMYRTFGWCRNLVNAPDMSNATSVTNMTRTFAWCTDLFNAPVIPNSVTSMYETFDNCSNLSIIPETHNDVTEMFHTFGSCHNIIDGPKLPNNLINMSNIFQNCRSLVNAPITPGSVTNMAASYQSCYSLINAPIIPNGVTDMYRTFGYCYSLNEETVSIPNTVINMCDAFEFCNGIINAPIISSQTVNLYGAFSDCYNLVNGGIIPNTVNDMNFSYVRCYELNNISEIPESVIYMRGTFHSCSKLSGDIIIYSKNVRNAYVCFSNTSLQKNVYIPFTYENNVNTRTYNSFNQYYGNGENGVTLMDIEPLINIIDWRYDTLDNGTRLLYQYTGSNDDIIVPFYKTVLNNYNYTDVNNAPFYNNQTVNSVDLKNTPFVNNSMTMAFYNCINLKEVTKINKSTIEMCNTFRSCSNLVNSPIIPNSVTNMESTFAYCYNLTNAPTIPNNVLSLSSTFWSCQNLTNAPTIPNNVTDMSEAFAHCYILNKAPTIPNTVTNMWYSFIDCYVIENSPIITESVTDMSSTFQRCINLSGDVYITSENIINANHCFYGTSLNKNVYIPFTYENNVNTLTYDSFINAGYSTSSRVNGALLMDIATKSYIIFNVTPIENTIKYLNGRQVDYDKSIANSDNEYVLYNENYPVIVGHVNNLTPQEEYTLTKDLTSVTGYTITLNTGLTGCEVTFDINGVKIPATVNGYSYSITLNTDEQITIGYTVEKLDYRPTIGTITFNNSNITENITMVQDIWTNWIRPNLTANGTMGGSSFAVEANVEYQEHYAYYAVDSDSSTYWNSLGDGEYTLYNPKLLKISQIVITYNDTSHISKNIRIEVKNQRGNWEQIYYMNSSGTINDIINLSSLNIGYNYYRLSLEHSGIITPIRISDIAITAQELQN